MSVQSEEAEMSSLELGAKSSRSPSPVTFHPSAFLAAADVEDSQSQVAPRGNDVRLVGGDDQRQGCAGGAQQSLSIPLREA